MVICVDLNGTLSAYPAQLGAILRALRAQGHMVHILTAVIETDSVTQEQWQSRADLLATLGLSDCYDALCVVPGPLATVPARKVLYMRSVGATAFIDNSLANARVATDAGIMTLVPWGDQ